VESLLAALTGALLVIAIVFIYLRLRGVMPLGLGDAKLLAMIGAFSGFMGLYCSIFLGALIGLAFYLPQIQRNKTLQFAIPFAPFLAAGAFFGIFCRYFEVWQFFLNP
jgi:leader peptidase (prepilin peptidase)/N-methyltransferase